MKKLKELIESLDPFYPVWPRNMAEINALELVIEILNFPPSQKVEILKKIVSCELTVDNWGCPEKYSDEDAYIEEDLDEDADDINRKKMILRFQPL